jgi:predicted kinase
LLELASAQGCAAVVVDCNAPLDELRRRIRERENDPSEANLQVLERQLEQQQPVDPAEAGITGIVRVGSGGLGDDHTQRIRELLLAEPVTVARPE